MALKWKDLDKRSIVIITIFVLIVFAMGIFGAANI